MPITLGQLVALLSGFASFAAILIGAFRLGVLAKTVDTNESAVVSRLEGFNQRFNGLETYIHDILEAKTDHETRLAVIERSLKMGGAA